jgi:hypothetical protein
LDEHDDPQWIRVLAFAIGAAVAAFGAVGLFLAVVGWYRRPLVLGAGALAFVGLCVLARPLLPRRGEVSRVAQICAVIAIVAVVAITVWNVSNASQQVLVIRDGGTYLNAGKWISAHGTLEVKPFAGPFTPKLLAASSAGMSREGNHLEFTLEHMFPALLAEAQGVGGDRLMFDLVPLLGGAALLAFYLFARRVLRHPIAALGAMLCLGLLMPQVSFSRDSTTEIPMQVLLFTAAWLLCDRRTLRHRGAAFTAGLFLGLLQAIHIDGLAFIVGLPFVCLFVWLGTERAERPRVGWAILFAGLGAATGVALGFFDLVVRSHLYLRTLRTDLVRLAVGAVAALVVAALLFAVYRWWSRRASELLPRVQRAQGPAALVAAAAVAVGGLGAWFVRPHLQTVRGSPNIVVKAVQLRTHLAVDPGRRYFEHSVQWVSWYVGPVTLALAIVGAAYATWRFVRGRLSLPAQAAGLVLGPPALLYFYKPSITADQIWSMRRFLPAAFPIVVLGAFGAICVLAARDRFGRNEARRALAFGLGVLAIAYPMYAIRNVSKMTDQRGYPPVVQDACRIVGRNGAIVVPQEAAPLTWLYDPQTLRSFCNVPVAIMLSGQKSALSTRLPGGRLDPRLLHDLARQWQQQHRELFVVAGNARTIRKLFPRAAIRVVPGRANPHLLVQTLVSRPDAFQTERLSFAIARVPAG